MSFLTHPEKEPDTVILLLLVAHQGRSNMLIYKWDSRLPLTELRPMGCSGQLLHENDSFPLLLIPSTNRPSFSLVTDTDFVSYSDILLGKVSRVATELPTEEKAWTQWIKPVRLKSHKRTKDDILLIREDGMIRALILSESSSAERSYAGSTAFAPGQLGIHVDKAVCALSAPPRIGGDILIACGDMTEGGVYHLAAREKPLKIQEIPNCSPLHDLAIINHKSYLNGSRDYSSALVTTGHKSSRSCLTELRYGVEARIETKISYEDAGSADALWVLQRPDNGRKLILISHHEHSSVLLYNHADTEQRVIDVRGLVPIQTDNPTLATAYVDDTAILQITTSQVNLLTGPTADSAVVVQYRGQIICADLELLRRLYVIAVAGGSGSFELLAGILTDSESESKAAQTTMHLAYTPTRMTTVGFGESVICLVTSQDSQLYVYRLAGRTGFEEVASFSLPRVAGREDFSVSSMCLLQNALTEQLLVICGSKTGHIAFCKLSVHPSERRMEARLVLDRLETMGDTTVHVTNDRQIEQTSAFICCGARMRQIRLCPNNTGLDYSIDAVHITDGAQHEYTAPSLTALGVMTQGPLEPSPTILGVTGDEIFIMSLNPPAILPRPVVRCPPSKRMLYIPSIRKCLVAMVGTYDKTTKLRGPPYLELLDPATPWQASSPPTHTRYLFGESGEKVRDMIMWSPTDGHSHFNFIVLGSERGADGRVAYLNVSRFNEDSSKVVVKAFVTYPNSPVSAICAFGLSSLIIGAGRTLKLVHLDIASKRWQNLAEFSLPSKALKLESKGSVVHVATSLHSFMLVRVQDDKFSLLSTDKYAGRARSIVPFGHSSTLVNLVSEDGSRVLGFSERPTKGTTPVFEARTPQSIDRLHELTLSTGLAARERFIGTTIDGTVYLFTLLKPAELALLKCLESFCQPTRNNATTQQIKAIGRRTLQRFAKNLESANEVTPDIDLTHAHGDLIKHLLEPGPYNLHNLLRRTIKVEGEKIKEENEVEKLRDLAHPVIGSCSNVADGVVLWLRRLLNVPVF